MAKQGKWTFEMRKTLESLIKAGKSNREISIVLGKPLSTVSYEINRQRHPSYRRADYDAEAGHEIFLAHIRARYNPRSKEELKDIADNVSKLYREGYSYIEIRARLQISQRTLKQILRDIPKEDRSFPNKVKSLEERIDAIDENLKLIIELIRTKGS